MSLVSMCSVTISLFRLCMCMCLRARERERRKRSTPDVESLPACEFPDGGCQETSTQELAETVNDSLALENPDPGSTRQSPAQELESIVGPFNPDRDFEKFNISMQVSNRESHNDELKSAVGPFSPDRDLEKLKKPMQISKRENPTNKLESAVGSFGPDREFEGFKISMQVSNRESPTNKLESAVGLFSPDRDFEGFKISMQISNKDSPTDNLESAVGPYSPDRDFGGFKISMQVSNRESPTDKLKAAVGPFSPDRNFDEFRISMQESTRESPTDKLESTVEPFSPHLDFEVSRISMQVSARESPTDELEYPGGPFSPDQEHEDFRTSVQEKSLKTHGETGLFWLTHSVEGFDARSQDGAIQQDGLEETMGEAEGGDHELICSSLESDLRLPTFAWSDSDCCVVGSPSCASLERTPHRNNCPEATGFGTKLKTLVDEFFETEQMSTSYTECFTFSGDICPCNLLPNQIGLTPESECTSITRKVVVQDLSTESRIVEIDNVSESSNPEEPVCDMQAEPGS